MRHVNLQFHVLPDELLDWVEEWKREFNLFVSAVRYFPQYRIRKITSIAQFRRQLHTARAPDEIWLSVDPFDLQGRTSSQLQDANAGSFFISFPESTPDGLRQTLMGAEAADAVSWPLWKKLVGRTKRQCKKGLWVFNPTAGVKGFTHSARYTTRVEEASRRGLVLLPLAGGYIMSIDEPEQGVRCD
jgi:hypothetical protein